MRARIWVPLPGPFAITSGGRRRQRQPVESTHAVSHRWLWFPGVPGMLNGAGFVVSVLIGFPWMLLAAGALVWDLLVVVGYPFYVAGRWVNDHSPAVRRNPA